MPRLLLIVDDDPLSREVLALLAEEAGFHPIPLDSGEAALAHLAVHPLSSPSALLVDMQMPGLAGDPLAQRLRGAAPLATLVAMSGTHVQPARRLHFDAFLLKPFAFDQFLAVLAHAPETPAPEPEPSPRAEPLSQATYNVLTQSMQPAQVEGLYAMLLDDADRRILLMRQALAAGDRDTWCRAAHAIKGGCGMVGALELASIAAAMEEDGLPLAGQMVDHLDPFAHFQAAAARLRSILSTHTRST